MPVIKSYYQTTPMTDEQLVDAINVSRDQENKIFQLFKKYGCMTTWDVYEVYNEVVGDILPSSVGRSINTLLKLNVISSLGTIPGENGRPVNLYQINKNIPDVISRRQSYDIPKSVKLDLKFTEDGSIDIEGMVQDLDESLVRIANRFNLNY
jgi:hypothetical protein